MKPEPVLETILRHGFAGELKVYTCHSYLFTFCAGRCIHSSLYRAKHRLEFLKILSWLVSLGCLLCRPKHQGSTARGTPGNFGPKWPTSCGFERRRNSIANCGRMVTNIATVTMESL